jgi:restriction endonuclease Mrr
MLELPKYQALIEPILNAIKENGGFAHNKEIEKRVIESLDIPIHLQEQVHSGSRTELSYRLGWAKTKAKIDGLIERTGKQTWSISHK